MTGPVAPATAGGPALPGADVLKALAAQLIVLHHLALYGPMADHAWPLAPALFAALAEHGRYAVQVFLVLGGYFAARSLAPAGHWPDGQGLWAVLWRRYLRLVLPLVPVLLLAVAAAALARAWMTHPATPAAPGAGQVLAQLLLLQDLLGLESLSAGLWYLSIDLQLYGVLALLLVAGARLDRHRPGREPLAPWLLFAGVAVSALWVNRWSSWDVVAPYFLASYGLGALLHWWQGRPWRLLAVALLVLAALALDHRIRLALALAVAAGLWLQLAWPARTPAVAPAIVRWLSRTSYALFLVHYPVGLVVNAGFERWLPHQPAVQAVGVVAAWAASLAVAGLFHRVVEAPLARHAQRLRPGRA